MDAHFPEVLLDIKWVGWWGNWWKWRGSHSRGGAAKIFPTHGGAGVWVGVGRGLWGGIGLFRGGVWGDGWSERQTIWRRWANHAGQRRCGYGACQARGQIRLER